MKKLFGTDGIRGVAGDFLTKELATSVGNALARILSKNNDKPKVMIGTDTRISKDMLKDALVNGLTLGGCDVFDIGVISTPAVAYLTLLKNADAGIMISASHNTFEYNGIKIFGADGFKLSDDDEAKIESAVFSEKASFVSNNSGTLIRAEEFKTDYIKHIKESVPQNLPISIVVDCANGSAATTAKAIFEGSCKRIDYIGCSPDGKNINDGCGSTALGMLKKAVTDSDADLGIAFDGDADRFLAIDENGNEIDGDHVLAILSLMLKDEGKLKKNTAVGTVMSNFGFSKFCADNGIEFVSTKVGDRYVLEEMEKSGYSLGGEQSGHVIIRELATTGDGQLTAVYMLKAIEKYNKSPRELASILKKYPQRMINVSANAEQKTLFTTSEEIKTIIADAENSLSGKGRILVRPSGTEPLVRIMVESTDEKETSEVCEEVARRIQQILSASER